MKNVMILFFLFALAGFRVEAGNEECMHWRLATNDKRYASFLLVLNLMEERGAKTLVETGTARGGLSNFAGDGGSTIIFGDWASRHGAKFYSVDISPGAIANAKAASQPYADYMEFVVEDSVKFLSEFSDPIDFLYLDSYDFEYYNPSPSQEHHLKEVIAAYPRLHNQSIVMIDDCALPHGGKGKLVIEYLVNLGWKILYNGYQVVLVKECP